MARISKRSTKTAQQAPAKAPKVARVTKGKGKAASGQQAPAKAPKSASGQQARRRNQYAGKAIKITPEGKAATPRGNAGMLWDVVSVAKKVDDVIGAEYARTGGKYDGETWTVKAVDLAYFERRGLIEIV